MAIVSKNSDKGNTQAANQTADKNKEKPVDLSNASLKGGKRSKLDPTEDAWTYSAPPEKGNYDLKIFLSKDGFSQGFIDPEDEDTVYYKANLECKIVSEDKEIDGFTCFGNVTTKISRGKKISTMAGLLVKMGFKIPDEASPLELAKMFKKALATEPILRDNELDWQGWSKNDQRVIYQSMDDFPEDEDGTPKHKVVITNKDGGREEINATLKIKVWGNKKKGVKGEDSPKPKKAEVVETEEEEDKPKPISAAKAGKDKDKKKKEPEPEPEVEDKEDEEEEDDTALLVEEDD